MQMTSETTLLEVYPEAEDFVDAVRNNGDLDRARIADMSNPPHAIPSAVYLMNIEGSERYWCITLIGADAQDYIRKEHQREPEMTDLHDPRTWAEVGIKLDRENPFWYIATRDAGEWAQRCIRLDEGFVPGKEREHFQKLIQLYHVIFRDKVTPEEVDYGAHKTLVLAID